MYCGFNSFTGQIFVPTVWRYFVVRIRFCGLSALLSENSNKPIRFFFAIKAFVFNTKLSEHIIPSDLCKKELRNCFYNVFTA